MNHAFHFALLLGLACLASSSPQAAYELQPCNTLDGGFRSAPDGSLPCSWEGDGHGICTHDREDLTRLCCDL